ncbi:hypothetical protein BZB76_5372 [Actinomadura pelletieri DSM 43383]|uniref:Uncharacterized protein n=1 Tax=Actinomadura pelletieri DSM 43383 TaxID=1120940 RepID=A0A495QG51_9ACTN|nr:hypothetical protein BZB76_5372 [Actinomadura pelletieri DSM 43383]
MRRKIATLLALTAVALGSWTSLNVTLAMAR